MSPKPKGEDPNYDLVMKLFQGKCAVCFSEQGVTVHEIVPKSLNPRGWRALTNRIPLCAGHHEFYHRMSRKDREPALYAFRERALKFLTN